MLALKGRHTLNGGENPRRKKILNTLKKVDKGGWRMPRLQEAKKDVISCEKLRGVANKL